MVKDVNPAIQRSSKRTIWKCVEASWFSQKLGAAVINYHGLEDSD